MKALECVLSLVSVTVSKVGLKDWRVSLAFERRWNDLAACHKYRLDLSSWVWDGKVWRPRGGQEPWLEFRGYLRPAINIRREVRGT